MGERWGELDTRETEPKGDDNDDDYSSSSGGETKYMVQSVYVHNWYSLADYMVSVGRSIDKMER